MAVDAPRVAGFEAAMRDLDLDTWRAVAAYLRPYTGASVVVLPSVFDLLAAETAPDEARDTDVSDSAIAGML